MILYLYTYFFNNEIAMSSQKSAYSDEMTMSKVYSKICSLCVLLLFFNVAGAAPDSLFVDDVWAGHPVGFDIYTSGSHQYVAYYDKDRNMAVAQRELKSKTWKKVILPSKIGWDSHNYVRLTMDKDGYLHVSGNMHNVPLIYFRSQKPHDITGFKPMGMTGVNEERVTYPVFFKDPAGDLYFQYRNGQSGQGSTYWKKYLADQKKWIDVFDKPLFDGENEANAYMSSLVQGPDGYFYMIWMWRLTYIANTNHNLSCVRTKDFSTWENIKGEKVSLPLKWSSNATTVDPVGPWNGLINMHFFISWDTRQRPCITYHKYDPKGLSQVFVSRWEGDQWKAYQVSSWESYKWNLDLGGSLPTGVRPSPLTVDQNGKLRIDYFHEQFGSGSWQLDPEKLTVVLHEPAPDIKAEPKKIHGLEMQSRSMKDNTGKFRLEWETLPANRDRPRELPADVVTPLYLHKVVR